MSETDLDPDSTHHAALGIRLLSGEPIV